MYRKPSKVDISAICKTSSLKAYRKEDKLYRTYSLLAVSNEGRPFEAAVIKIYWRYGAARWYSCVWIWAPTHAVGGAYAGDLNTAAQCAFKDAGIKVDPKEEFDIENVMLGIGVQLGHKLENMTVLQQYG